jgi:hypothetical protein
MYKKIATTDRPPLAASPIAKSRKSIGGTTFKINELTGSDGAAIKNGLPPKRSSSSNDMVQLGEKSPSITRNFSLASLKED